MPQEEVVGRQFSRWDDAKRCVNTIMEGMRFRSPPNRIPHPMPDPSPNCYWPPKNGRLVAAALCLVVAVAHDCSAAGRRIVEFEKEIRPALVKDCLKCHGANKQEGELRLDSLAAMLKGGESGPAIVPGKPDESLLMEALRYDSFEMPPENALPDSVIGHFERWIADGAVWPEASQTIRESTAGISDADRQWWAFQRVEKPEPPLDQRDHWSRNPIDKFVIHRLSSQGMQPAPRASKEVLVRRLYFDLLGMPPTPTQIQQFVNDDSPDAWQRLVDALLRDERYGEHWARYWLDLVRFSESDGWNQDAFRKQAWRYRDYVVKAMNRDKPYPQFVREQLAGDEIPGAGPDQLAAAGFLRLGIYEYNQRDARGHWNDIMNDMTDVAGDVFLGMSMACCRCHDHKFDPLLQKDYFRLRAFFEPIIWRDDIPAATEKQTAEYQKQRAVWNEATLEVRAQIDALLAPYIERKWKSTVDKFPLEIQACFYKPVSDRTSWEHQMAYLVSRQFEEEGGGPLKSINKEDKQKHEAMLKALAAFDDLKPAPLPEVMTVTDFAGAISPTLIPDIQDQDGIDPGFLLVMAPTDATAKWSTSRLTSDSAAGDESSGRRTTLANWIGRADNPLTTRVIVNRIWQQHFGKGIVETSNDFGRNGQPPSHPELLDWLTSTFVENGWSFKQLHRLILTSSAWRQSTEHPQASEYQSIDPADKLLWRMSVRRLRAEEIRDSMLLASGELIQKVGGPSVDDGTPRRGLYVKSFRNNTENFLHAFDVANGLKSVAVRDTTTTPTQSLLLINGKYTIGRAKVLADRLSKEHHGTADEVLGSVIKLVWGREPTIGELEASRRFVSGGDDVAGEERQQEAAIDQQRLLDFCHVLFNSNEFLYVK